MYNRELKDKLLELSENWSIKKSIQEVNLGGRWRICRRGIGLPWVGGSWKWDPHHEHRGTPGRSSTNGGKFRD